MAESGCAASPPLVHVDPENPDDTPQPPPLPPRPRAQFNSVAVRLGSNRLRSLEGLRAFLAHVLDSPEQLAWLDVSCNQLERVDTVLQDYPNLKVRAVALYLSFLCEEALAPHLCAHSSGGERERAAAWQRAPARRTCMWLLAV